MVASIDLKTMIIRFQSIPMMPSVKQDEEVKKCHGCFTSRGPSVRVVKNNAKGICRKHGGINTSTCSDDSFLCSCC